MTNLSVLISSIDFVLKYGGSKIYIDKIKHELSEVDTDTKLFIISQYPQSIKFMCENQPEEFLLEVVEFFPCLFKYFANTCNERVCIKALEKDKNNYQYITNPSLLLHALYTKLYS